MDSADPLSQLADIHLPAEIGFWPPALGWWVLLILFLAAAVFAGIRLLRLWQRKRRCTFALAELEKCYNAYRKTQTDTSETEGKLNLVNDVNAVLRRVALKHFPDSQVASLGGGQWVSFIREHGNAQLLDEELAVALAQGRFARECHVDTEQLHAMAQHWIKGLYLAKLVPTQPHNGAPEHA